MALKSINPTHTKTWEKLTKHFDEIKNDHLKQFFEEDTSRADRFTIKWEDFYLDYSKNRINSKTISLLKELTEETKLKEAISKYFSGDIINQTENRAVLHTALRLPQDDELLVDGKNVIPEVNQVKKKIEDFEKYKKKKYYVEVYLNYGTVGLVEAPKIILIFLNSLIQ